MIINDLKGLLVPEKKSRGFKASPKEGEIQSFPMHDWRGAIISCIKLNFA
jgi:hypothetical protein